MNTADDKHADGLDAWTRHYQRVAKQGQPRRASRIRHRRGINPRRLAFLLLGIAVTIAALALGHL